MDPSIAQIPSNKQVHIIKCKIVLIGDQKCGKTSIMNYQMHQTFQPITNGTIGIDFVSKTYKRNQRTIRIQCWDTAGQQRFYSILPSYIRDSHAVVIVVDLANEESIKSIPKWVKRVQQSGNISPLKFILGNKIDLDVSLESCLLAQQYAEKFGFNFRTASAKTGTDVNSFFNQIVDLLLDQNQPNLDEVKEVKPAQRIPAQKIKDLLQHFKEQEQAKEELNQEVKVLEQKVKDLQQKLDSMAIKAAEPKKSEKSIGDSLMFEATKQAIKVCDKLPCPCFKKSAVGLQDHWQEFGQWAVIHKDSCDLCRQILKEYTIKYCEQKMAE